MKKRIIGLAVAAAVLLGWWLWYSSVHALTVSRFVLPVHVTAPVRIAALSDLHSAVFGPENQRLVEKVAAQQPDLILMPGDLLDGGDADTEMARALVEQLTAVAPVYISLGNHELLHEARFGTDVQALFSGAGAHVLERSWEDITVNGQALRVGGIYGYCTPEQYLATNEADPEECAFLRQFQDTTRLSLLLCHMPFAWIYNNGISKWDTDLVFAGHTHGGQVRLPFVGGIWAPDAGWFPGKEGGVYPSDDGEKALLLTRGLGSAASIPRFNNIPEIMIVDLIPKA